MAAQAASEVALEHGMNEVRVEIKGKGPGKDAARKQIEVAGIKILEVKDVTPAPYNGTRPPRRAFKRATARK